MIHFTSRLDWHMQDLGDVTDASRAEEIHDLVDRLANFQPTHVAVEHEHVDDDALNARYQEFLAGNLTLRSTEVEQVGFRLAGQAGHSRIYPIDWMGLLPGQRGYGEVLEWAKSHQPELYRELAGGGSGTTSAAAQPLVDLIRHANQPDWDRQAQRNYLRLAQIGDGDDYVGLDWLTWWYRRNLTLYVNIARLAETPRARILVLIGAGHRFLLHQFLRDSGRYTVEDVGNYLA